MELGMPIVLLVVYHGALAENALDKWERILLVNGTSSAPKVRQGGKFKLDGQVASVPPPLAKAHLMLNGRVWPFS